MHPARTFWIAAIAGAAMLGQAIAPPAARAETATPACTAHGEAARLDQIITRTAARLAEGRVLKIVAFGSSSTEGTGASSPDHTYPARLEAELRARFPDMDIVVLNRGVGGEDAREMLARLEKSVISEHPDLVLWQVGTNAIVDGDKPSDEAVLVRIGLARLKAAGIDVVLVDPQFAPRVIAKPHAVAMVRMLETVAEQARVAVFHRFAIMSDWRRVEHISFAQFTSRDGLHLNDWSYDCMAKLLAASIVDAAARPVASRQTTHRTRS